MLFWTNKTSNNIESRKKIQIRSDDVMCARRRNVHIMVQFHFEFFFCFFSAGLRNLSKTIDMSFEQ